jgi:hypothetical protein
MTTPSVRVLTASRRMRHVASASPNGMDVRRFVKTFAPSSTPGLQHTTTSSNTGTEDRSRSFGIVTMKPDDSSKPVAFRIIWRSFSELFGLVCPADREPPPSYRMVYDLLREPPGSQANVSSIYADLVFNC